MLKPIRKVIDPITNHNHKITQAKPINRSSAIPTIDKASLAGIFSNGDIFLSREIFKKYVPALSDEIAGGMSSAYDFYTRYTPLCKTKKDNAVKNFVSFLLYLVNGDKIQLKNLLLLLNQLMNSPGWQKVSLTTFVGEALKLTEENNSK